MVRRSWTLFASPLAQPQPVFTGCAHAPCFHEGQHAGFSPARRVFTRTQGFHPALAQPQPVSLAVHPRQVFTAVRIGQVFTALGRSLPPCKLGLVFTTLDWFSPSTRRAGLHRPRQVFTAVRIGQVFTALGRSLPPCNRSATAGFHWLCTRILLYPCHYTCRLSHHCL
jgi:hypothetical protein